jgi:hypothetical protein
VVCSLIVTKFLISSFYSITFLFFESRFYEIKVFCLIYFMNFLCDYICKFITWNGTLNGLNWFFGWSATVKAGDNSKPIFFFIFLYKPLTALVDRERCLKLLLASAYFQKRCLNLTLDSAYARKRCLKLTLDSTYARKCCLKLILDSAYARKCYLNIT